MKQDMRYTHGSIFETFPFVNNLLFEDDETLERMKWQWKIENICNGLIETLCGCIIVNGSLCLKHLFDSNITFSFLFTKKIIFLTLKSKDFSIKNVNLQ